MADTTISGLTLTTPTPSFLLPCSDGSTTYSSCISSMFLNMGNKYINVFGNSNEFNTGTGLVLRNSYSGHGFTSIYFGNDASFNAGAVWQGSSNYTYYAGPSSMNIGTLINSPLGLVAGNSVRMLITSGGNVGVGTNTPQAKLDVVGDVKATNTPKAWVNFDGTGAIGTNQTIRSSYNVASVYKGNTGSYRITFTSAQTDNNYCVTGASAPAYSAYWTSLALHTAAPTNGGTESAPTNAYFDVCVVMQTTGKVDSKYVSVVVL